MRLAQARVRLMRRKTLGQMDLRGRLMWLAMLPVLVFALVWGVYVIRQRATDLEAQLQQRAQLLARQLAIAADYGIFSFNQAALDNIAQGVVRESSVIAVTIVASDGRMLASHQARQQAASPLPSTSPSASPSTSPSAPTSPVQALLSAFQQGNGEGVSQKTAQWIAHLEPIRSPLLMVDDLPEQPAPGQSSALQGHAIVQVSTASIKAELFDFGLRVTALLAGVLLSGWFMARRFSTRIDERIQALVQAAQRIGQGAVGTRLLPSQIPSFNRLSQDINSMAGQLEQSRLKLEQRVHDATQALREQRDAAQQANHDKTRFLAAASHDLRQPMHALNMLVDAVKHTSHGPDRARLLERIEATSQAMSNLLDALLDISRLDAGGVSFQHQPIALQPLLLRLRDTYEGQAERKAITLVVHTAPACVRSDPLLLERILGNFLSNALRYTPEGGCVMLAVRQRADHTLIQIRDNGPGIAADSQQAIFQEFVQLHNPQRDRSQGLGLGLAIVQRLAQLLNHPIGLRSCPGHGSSFSIQLPPCDLHQDAPATPVCASAQPIDTALPTLAGCRILLVEDDALVRESYTHLLQLWQCDTRAHATATAALADPELPTWRPHLIIADHRLEGPLNGRQLILEIRRLLGTELPAIIMTGDTEDPTLRQAATHTLRILYKPVKPAELRQILLQLWRAATQ
jgi:signal transduction histidine kinase